MGRSKVPLFDAPIARTLGATLGALVTAVVVTAAMPLYLPFSQADSIGVPILLFPFTWIALFLYCALCKHVGWAWLLMLACTLSHAALIFFSLRAGG